MNILHYTNARTLVHTTIHESTLCSTME